MRLYLVVAFRTGVLLGAPISRITTRNSARSRFISCMASSCWPIVTVWADLGRVDGRRSNCVLAVPGRVWGLSAASSRHVACVPGVAETDAACAINDRGKGQSMSSFVFNFDVPPVDPRAEDWTGESLRTGDVFARARLCAARWATRAGVPGHAGRAAGGNALPELKAITGDPEASLSARIRDLRKQKHGGHHVEHRVRTGHAVLWEYKLETA